MAGERYRHIFLTGPTRTQGFTNPRKGGHKPRIPDRNRSSHSAYLHQRLQETWEEYERQRQAVVHVERHGAYIEFVSEPGFDLMIQSLEFLPSGIRIHNVRKEGEGDLERTLATVYVPHEKRGFFLRKIQAYTTEVVKSSKKPKNANLVNSISDIHLAVLESFFRSDEKALIPDDNAEWIEVWLSSDQEEVVSGFETLLQNGNIEFAEGVLKFPERAVKLVLANRGQLEYLIESSDDIAEFRLGKEVASFYVEMENREQSDLVDALLERCRYDGDTDVFICILDTGVNNGHLLLKPVLDDNDLLSVRPEWGNDDHNGHGTLMAGTAVYGDLLSLLNERRPVRVLHRLESVKILPPPPEHNLKKLWGEPGLPFGLPLKWSSVK